MDSCLVFFLSCLFFSLKVSRFGSGCYNYICAAGQLYIMVRDISYSCGFEGQRIPIQLKVGSCTLYLGLSSSPPDGLLDPQWLCAVPLVQLPLL